MWRRFLALQEPLHARGPLDALKQPPLRSLGLHRSHEPDLAQDIADVELVLNHNRLIGQQLAHAENERPYGTGS